MECLLTCGNLTIVLESARGMTSCFGSEKVPITLPTPMTQQKDLDPDQPRTTAMVSEFTLYFTPSTLGTYSCSWLQ